MNDLVTKMWYFEGFDLFKRLQKADMEYLAETAQYVRVLKNEFVYFPQDEADTIFLLKNGKVKIGKYNDDGREIIFNILGSGEVFGEMAFLENTESRNELATALEDACILKVKVEDINKILKHNPYLNPEITKLIGMRLRKIKSRLETMWFKSTTDRIKCFLKEMIDDHGREIDGRHEVKLNLTHQDIANLTATNRQTVTTILRDMQKAGFIDYNRRKITVNDMRSITN